MIRNFRPAAGFQDRDQSEKTTSTTRAAPVTSANVYRCGSTDILGKETYSADDNYVDGDQIVFHHAGLILDLRSPTERNYDDAQRWMENATTITTDNDNNDTINNASFRIIKKWFGHVVKERDDVSWQVFFGGDGSGATYHWHDAAFNMLYVGVKEWKIAPPLYRGWSGMPALLASKALDMNIVTTDSLNSNSNNIRTGITQHIPTLRCVQKPGDLFFIPNSWGHMTINHGFTIGAAAIMPDYYQKDGTSSFRNGGEE